MNGIVTCLGILTFLVSDSPAGDWPQILGPDRNGSAAPDEQLAESWPDGGPPKVWEIPVGRGFAGVSVVGSTLYLFDRIESRERVQALNAADATPLWSQTYTTGFVPQYGRDDGPMCVPTVVNGAVVTFGAEGFLACFEAESGQARWQHDTQTDFDALEGFFGAGSSPLVVDGRVIVNVGGRSQKAGMVAFDLANGGLLWTSVEDGSSYSSPVIVTLNGEPRVVALTRLKCVVLDPTDGTIQAEFPYGLRGPTVTAANPLMVADKLFLSASYGIGARLVDLSGAAPDTVWDSDDLMSSQYTTCIEDNGLLYGVDGRQDIPPATLKCFDPLTRKVMWSQAEYGYATLIKADGKLIAMKTDGTLVLAALVSDEYRELAKARIFQDTVRALPALSNGKLYVRDGSTLKCLNLGARP